MIAAADQFVIVLHYWDRSGIQGTWGPYNGRPAADAALAELERWPMDGIWEVREMLAADLPKLIEEVGP